MEAIWVEIFIKSSRSILVCILYRPPDSSKHLSTKFTEVFDETIATALLENKETIILGDVNYDFMKVNDNKGVKDILKCYGMKQMIKSPTRITPTTKSLIDIIATTHEEHVHSHIVTGNPISDHELIGLIRKMNCKIYKPGTVITRNYAKYNKYLFRQELKGMPWYKVTSNIDLNTAWNCFKTMFSAAIDKHAPMVKRSVRGRDCPWRTNSIKIKMLQYKYSYVYNR